MSVATVLPSQPRPHTKTPGPFPEGVVSKRRNGMYHARRCDWVKVKTPEWKEVHKDRGATYSLGSASQWTIFANRAPATNADVHANVAIRKFLLRAFTKSRSTT